MIYPKFLNNNSKIGICAPSMGVYDKLSSYKHSIDNLSKYYKVIETKSVRNKGLVSNTPKVRAKELEELYLNKEVDLILCASGGEILMDMLPEINDDYIKSNPKWIQGYSDPTTLLYYITTKLDIASIYGVNAGGFDQNILYKSLIDNLEILKGNIKIQHSYEYYEKDKGEKEYNLDTKVKWLSNKESIELEGRLIGGCIDSLNDIIGSKYDYTSTFIEKYKKDGIIWYFDVYDMSSLQLYRTLLHMKYTGWFKYSKCFIFGRVLIPNEIELTYKEVISKIFEDIPYIIDADIGHTNPKITLINGSICNIKYKDNSATVALKLL